MRILMTIHHHLDHDAGAPGATMRLAEQYTAAAHEVELYSFDDLPRALPAKSRALAFPAFVAAHVRRRLREGGVDVVDASTGDSARLDAVSPLLRRTLLVVRSHGLEHGYDRYVRAEAAAQRLRLSWRYPLYHGGYRLREVARAMRRADLSLVLNTSDWHLAVGQLGLSPDRVRIVPNGVSEHLVLGDEAVPVGQPVERVVQIGAYLPRKGTAYGRAALTAVLTRHRWLRVAFLGTGRAGVHVLADFSAALHDRISVVERYRNEDLPDLLGPHDINLLPTMSEGSPGALLEAMARGLPSVVTGIPGTDVFCRDGRNALIVPPADATALAAALDRLIESPTLRERLSRAAVATARERTWPRVAALNLDIYERALADKRAAAAGTAPSRRTGSSQQTGRCG